MKGKSKSPSFSQHPLFAGNSLASLAVQVIDGVLVAGLGAVCVARLRNESVNKAIVGQLRLKQAIHGRIHRLDPLSPVLWASPPISTLRMCLQEGVIGTAVQGRTNCRG
jgi:hypothetical protein